MLQAVVIGSSIAALVLIIARGVGKPTAIIVAVGLFDFAFELAIGNVTTEVLGLSAGAIGLALLGVYALSVSKPVALLLSGLAVLSVGMAARSGAVLALPLLILWACLVAISADRKRRLWQCSLNSLP